MTTPRIVFACESLSQGNGGISRVDRLIAGILSEEVAAGRLRARLVVLFDKLPEADAPSNLEICFCGGSRLKFVLALLRESLTSGYFIYDAAYLARAHPSFPWMKSRCMIFMMGIEVWEECKKPWLTALRRADLLVSISEYTRQRAASLHGGLAQATICWLATEPDTEDLTVLSAPKRLQVLVVGRMVPENAYKGHRELIECWPQVLESVPEAKLVFIGRGGLVPELRKLTSDLDLNPNVEFMGFVSEGELNEAYARSMAFAMPSRGEGFGLVYIEAMRHRLPVIASVHDAGSEVVIDGVTGILVDLDKPGDLAKSIVRLLAQAPIAKAMGEAGYQRWKENFTYDAFRGRVLAILSQFLGQPGR